MSSLTLEQLKQAMVGAGLEIYRVSGTDVRIAERVRMHLMDSGVCVSLGDAPRIRVTVRSQRSDFPTGRAEELYELVRRAVKPAAADHGFHELGAEARNITDPVDASSVLDVWHELTFAKELEQTETLIEDLQWALRLPKCVTP